MDESSLLLGYSLPLGCKSIECEYFVWISKYFLSMSEICWREWMKFKLVQVDTNIVSNKNEVNNYFNKRYWNKWGESFEKIIISVSNKKQIIYLNRIHSFYYIINCLIY